MFGVFSSYFSSAFRALCFSDTSTEGMPKRLSKTLKYGVCSSMRAFLIKIMQ
jgi:hypothetical protein